MAIPIISREEILKLLREGPARIAAATGEIAPERLRARPAPEEWSANEVLAHLRACGDVWGGYIHRIAEDDHPTIRAINPRTWMAQMDYQELDFRPSLAAYTAQRQDLLVFLEGLEEASWQRAATVKGAGKPLEHSLRFYAEGLATHERAHIKQIERLARGWR